MSLEHSDLTSATVTVITIRKRNGERYVVYMPEQQRVKWEDYKKRAIAEGRMIDHGNGTVSFIDKEEKKT